MAGAEESREWSLFRSRARDAAKRRPHRRRTIATTESGSSTAKQQRVRAVKPVSGCSPQSQIESVSQRLSHGAELSMESGSSSPDPLGQPDLSSPLNLKTPTSTTTRSGGSSRRRLHRSSNGSATARRNESAAEPDEISNLDFTTPSPEPVGFELSAQLPVSAERKLLSPWRHTGDELREQEQQEGEEMEPVMDFPSSPSSLHSPEAEHPNGAVVTTTVPLKTGEETPRRRKKRRPLTPKKRRRNTPVGRRMVYEEEEREHSDEDQEVIPNDEPVLSPTPRKKGPGRPRNTGLSVGDGTSDDVSSSFRSHSTEITAAPGASPGKRRRVVSGGEAVSLSAQAPQAEALNGSASSPSRVNAQTSPRPLLNGTKVSNSKSMAPPLPPPRNLYSISQDPTEEHEEFDSIVESEDFTMVSLSSIPSGQQLRSLTRGAPSNQNSDKPVRNSPRRSPRNVRSPPGHIQSNTAAPPSPPAVKAQIQSTDIQPPSSSEQPPNTPYGNGLLAGFSPATRRELRAGLRLGQEIARRSVQAKKAAAEIEDATGDVFAELAATEGSNISTSPNSSRMDRRAPASAQLLRPLGGPTVTRPTQLPSPDQSDEQENANDRANEMSWKFDTPRKARLGLPQTRNQQPQSTPPRRKTALSSDQDDGAHVNSSPDKQLFLEQAAAEIESSRLRPNTSAVVEISSAEPESDDSSEEEPLELSEATRSILADATSDIWQTEAESSKASTNSRKPKTAAESLLTSQPAAQAQTDKETDLPDLGVSNDPDVAMVVDEEREEIEEADEDDESNIPGTQEPDEEIEGLAIKKEEASDGQTTLREEEYAKDDSEEEVSEVEHAESDDVIEDLEVDDEAETVNLRERERAQEQQRRRRSVEVSQSPPDSSPPRERIIEKVPEVSEKTIFDGELMPPKRGKLLSLWRRQSDEPIVYSDEPELPPAEDAAVLGKRRKTFVTPEARKKARYNDADLSVLSEFRDSSTRTNMQFEREPVSSPLKRVRFESEDPENPYFPTTPVLPTVPQIYEDPEEEEEEAGNNNEGGHRPEEEVSYEEEEVSITWDEKPKTPPRQGSWLTGWLPAWFQVPKDPIFRFSLPNLPQLRSDSKPAPTSEPRSYQPKPPTPDFSAAHYSELKRLYQYAKERPFRMPRDDHMLQLLGWEIRKMGWRKRVNHWELGIIAEFLRPGNPLARGVTPEQVARRLFSIWAVEVQKGETGLGRATAGLFSTRYVSKREQILAKARRKKSMAAS